MAGLTVLAVGLFKGLIGVFDVGVVAIGFSCFSLLTAKTVTGLEGRSKSLPVEGQQRTDGYNEIIRKWTNDLFPDW